MPTYLCHGFRWHRPSIRVFVVVQNIDEAAPEWIIAPDSSNAILRSFYSLFDFLPDSRRDGLEDRQRKKIKSRKREAPRTPPENALIPGLTERELALPPPSVPPEADDVLVNEWSAVKLLEEYDPTDLTSASRPYAFVADHVVRVDLNVSIVEEMARYEDRMAAEPSAERAMAAPSSDDYKNKLNGKKSTGKKAGWLEKLRDQLQLGEDIRWYVVVCGDEEREVDEEVLEESRAARENTYTAREEPPLPKAPEVREPEVRTGGHSRAASQQSSTGNVEPRPPGRERSTSTSRRLHSSYSPFPPAAPPQPAAPPVLRKPSMGSLTVPRPPTRDGGPLGSHPQMPPEQLPPVKTPHKSSSLRRLFSRREASS